MTRKFIGNEPFAVLLGDDIIYSEVPALRQMINQYERYGASIVGVQEVPLADTSKYGIVDGEKFADRLYRAKNMVEKPRLEDAPETYLAIMGRYILIRKFLIFKCPSSGQRWGDSAHRWD